MSRDQAVTNHSEKETSQLVLPRESESQASSWEGDDAGAPRSQPDQVWCKVVKGGCTASLSPPNPVPWLSRKEGDNVPLAPRERESFPLPPLQQETPPTFPPRNGNHWAPLSMQLTSRATEQHIQVAGTLPQCGPPGKPWHTHLPTLPLHTRFRMWVHRAVPRAHKCFSAEASRLWPARLGWKYRRRPCTATGADGVSRILGPAALRGRCGQIGPCLDRSADEEECDKFLASTAF